MESHLGVCKNVSNESNQSDRIVRLDAIQKALDLADHIYENGYFISSNELAEIMEVQPSAITSRGECFAWRNWIVSRVRREGNQILWQFDRLDE
ncbi:MAG: hypothetical protein F6J97_17755 [Leptolyngbya sp. SIO4C1]|nr:hypothetical protein [Leptolyngbya sp. SIO4C1]